MQAVVADPAKLAEDLEVRTRLREDAARLEQQLVEVAVKLDAPGFKRPCHRLVATGFVDTVFLIGVNRLDTVLPAQLKEHRRGLVPGGRGTNQQRNIELLQAVAQGAQVAQPEVDLARRIVMGQPLLGADQVYGQGGAAFGSGAQGGVVVVAQVGAQPDQLHVIS